MFDRNSMKCDRNSSVSDRKSPKITVWQNFKELYISVKHGAICHKLSYIVHSILDYSIVYSYVIVYTIAYSKLLNVWQKYTALWNSAKQWFYVIFCQTLMSFCHTSLNFCQTLVVTLTVCCSVNVRSHVWQNCLCVWQNFV